MNTLFEKFVKDTGLADPSEDDFYDQTWLPVPNDSVEKNAFSYTVNDNTRLFVTSVTNKQDQSQNVIVTFYNTMDGDGDYVTHVYVITNADQCDATVVLIKSMLSNPTFAKLGRMPETLSAVN